MNPITSPLVRTSLLTGVALAAGAFATQAQNHYPSGVEGIKGASLPPPGLYLRDYNYFYLADRLNDAQGNEVPIDFDATVYVNAIRPVYITKYQVFGGYYGMDILVPLVYSDLKVAGAKDSSFGIGDVFFEPVTLSWHADQYDIGLGYGVWAPTGDYDPTQLSNAGQNFWSHMFTAGATWYPTKDKSWSFSILNRYEIHTKEDKLGITYGNTLTTEWGFAKGITEGIELGLSGYLRQQITDDSGPGPKAKERAVGVGPEISAFCPYVGMFISLRYAREFAVENAPEGNTIVLTLTKKF